MKSNSRHFGVVIEEVYYCFGERKVYKKCLWMDAQ
jgi:hypothetical protein